MLKPQFCIHVQTSSTKQNNIPIHKRLIKFLRINLFLSCKFFYFSATHLMLNNAEKKIAIKTDTGTISKHVVYKKYQEYFFQTQWPKKRALGRFFIISSFILMPIYLLFHPVKIVSRYHYRFNAAWSSVYLKNRYKGSRIDVNVYPQLQNTCNIDFKKKTVKLKFTFHSDVTWSKIY